MNINFKYKGISYSLPLILNPNMATFNSLAIVQIQSDTRPRLQLVSTGYTNEELIKVKHLSVMTSAYIPNVGRVLLSKSNKRAWLNDGYCHQLKDFTITD